MLKRDNPDAQTQTSHSRYQNRWLVLRGWALPPGLAAGAGQRHGCWCTPRHARQLKLGLTIPGFSPLKAARAGNPRQWRLATHGSGARLPVPGSFAAAWLLKPGSWPGKAARADNPRQWRLATHGSGTRLPSPSRRGMAAQAKSIRSPASCPRFVTANRHSRAQPPTAAWQREPAGVPPLSLPRRPESHCLPGNETARKGALRHPSLLRFFIVPSPSPYACSPPAAPPASRSHLHTPGRNSLLRFSPLTIRLQ
ncbi:hypothetical protein PM3016_6213 [Paenibacillus mucilaginosus 3016]|uniref:Uncharacterized protein n=1 Tax=Paenibacillus mucilaginosus 3016 TaxID=1116391 RepID=H6NRW6_9BACL|nr:hypothetical protein PM3016_6213 [Paenibacillus mucilaginosus 3016]